LAGKVTFLAVGSVIVYIFLKHNVLGYVFVSFFYRVRTVTWYGVDELNEDGYYGWKPLRTLLISVYVSVLISLVAFLSLFSVINVRAIWLEFPLLLLYIVGVPAYVLGPLYLLNRVVSRFKAEEGDKVRTRFMTKASGLAPESSELRALEEEARTEMSRIRTIRPQLFRPRSVFVGGVVYVIPIVTLVLRWTSEGRGGG